MDQWSQLGVGQTSRHVTDREVDCHWKLLFTMNINCLVSKGWLVICYFPFDCTWFSFGHFAVWQLSVEKLRSTWLIRKNSLNTTVPDRTLTMSSHLIAAFPSNTFSSPSICVEGRGWSFEGNFIWQTVLKQLVCFKNLYFAFVNHLVWFSPSNAPSRPSEAFEGQLCSFEGVSMRTRCWQLLKVCKYYVVQHRLVSPVRRHAA